MISCSGVVQLGEDCTLRCTVGIRVQLGNPSVSPEGARVAATAYLVLRAAALAKVGRIALCPMIKHTSAKCSRPATSKDAFGKLRACLHP